MPEVAVTLVCGVDSSTQSVKVSVRELKTGRLVREGRSSHPEGTECDPSLWWSALNEAIDRAGGLNDVSAIAIAGQQHGLVLLDKDGEVIRNAILWNDNRSASAAIDLHEEFGGSSKVVDLVGYSFVASITITKLRWLADNEPENAAKVHAVLLPHDWLSWKLCGGRKENIEDIFTDRSDASGTGYFDSRNNSYKMDMFHQAIRNSNPIILPRVLSPHEIGGTTSTGVKVAAGMGDNAAAALGLFCQKGDVVVSLGTSGTVFAVCEEYPCSSVGGDGSSYSSSSSPAAPPAAAAIFASATGTFLPLLCTLNAAQILDAATKLLNVTHDELSTLALSANPGADGIVVLPYFNGERTPNRPFSKGVFSGITIANAQPKNFARAMIEGMLCNLVDAVDVFSSHKGVLVERIVLIGGAAKNKAVQSIASALLSREVHVPPAREYVADGAAIQAAWSLLGTLPENWQSSINMRNDTVDSGGCDGGGIDGSTASTEIVKSSPTPQVMEAYRLLRSRTETW